MLRTVAKVDKNGDEIYSKILHHVTGSNFKTTGVEKIDIAEIEWSHNKYSYDNKNNETPLEGIEDITGNKLHIIGLFGYQIKAYFIPYNIQD